MDLENINSEILQGGGSVAQRLLANGMNVGALRPWVAEDGFNYITVNEKGVEKAVRFSGNATLRKDEWKALDTAVLKAAQTRLVGVADLEARGLTFNLANGLGTTVFQYEDMSDVQGAQVSMDGVTRGENDRVEFDINSLPMPITHGDFQLNIRALTASRTLGAPLDTTIAELKARKIAEKIEEYLFVGSSTYTFGGGTIYGYLDQPAINSVTLSQNWDASGKTGAEIMVDVLAMKQACINARHYGPYMMYIPTAYEATLDDDFKANSDVTIRERILKIANIIDIKVADSLTANNVLMVQMTSDVVRMINGLAMTTVEWTSEGGMIFHFKIMQISVPQIRADQNDRSGVCLLS